MDTDELEKILGRVAKLVDEEKRDDLISRLPYQQMPPKKVRELSKGEILAEVLFFEFCGFVRNKLMWYSYDDESTE